MRVAYVREVYRWRIVLKSRGDAAFRALLRGTVDEWNKANKKRSVRLFVDLTGDTENA